MKTRLLCGGAASLIVSMIITASNIATAEPIPSPRPEAVIEISWQLSIERGIFCIYMYNTETRERRRICPEEDGCWDDSGWMSPQPTIGGEKLPTYFDSYGNLYIMVSPDQGGTFSGSTIGTCLPFARNGSGAIMLPAQLVY